jgi:hypothetical protein
MCTSVQFILEYSKVDSEGITTSHARQSLGSLKIMQLFRNSSIYCVIETLSEIINRKGCKLSFDPLVQCFFLYVPWVKKADIYGICTRCLHPLYARV